MKIKSGMHYSKEHFVILTDWKYKHKKKKRQGIEYTKDYTIDEREQSNRVPDTRGLRIESFTIKFALKKQGTNQQKTLYLF